MKPEDIKRVEELLDAFKPDWRIHIRYDKCEGTPGFLWPLADGTFRCEHKMDRELNWSGKPRGLFD